jgi:hypothetical protein
MVTRSDLDRLVTIIVNEAYDHIQEHFVLVLDDYHFVDDIEESGLSFDELAFRADEIQSLVLQNHHITLPDSVID